MTINYQLTNNDFTYQERWKLLKKKLEKDGSEKDDNTVEREKDDKDQCDKVIHVLGIIS